jgi:glycosyltransferase involved in cell wall biosynthesis
VSFEKSPLVSVVVPVFNGGKYLPAALKSLTRQTYQNIEIFVIDDGSEDSSVVEQIVEEIGDKRIQLIKKKNGGVSTVLNLAIEMSNGKYFTWLSHDDLFLPNKIKVQVEALELKMNPKLIHYTSYRKIDERNRIIHTANLSAEIAKSVSPLGPVERGILYGCTAMFDLNFMKSVGRFDENLRYVQDYDYWLKLVDANAEFELLDEPLVDLRIHSEQTGKTNDTYNENFFLWEKIANKWVDYCEDNYDDKNNLLYLKEFKNFVIQNKVEGALPILNQFMGKILSKYKLTVIVPTRGRIHLIQRCIKSILDQNLTNLQILIIDDNSDSKLSSITKNIIESFNDTRLELQKNSQLRGPAGARNHGLNIAQGQFVAFLDSDDYFLPGKLEIQILEMLINDADFSHTNYLRFYETKSRYSIVDTSHHVGKLQLNYIIQNGCGISTSTCMIRFASPISSIRFDEDKRFGEDIFYYLDVLYSSAKNLLHLDILGTCIRLHIESASQNEKAQQLHAKNMKLLINRSDPQRMDYILKANDQEYYRGHHDFNRSKILFLSILGILLRVAIHIPFYSRFTRTKLAKLLRNKIKDKKDE